MAKGTHAEKIAELQRQMAELQREKAEQDAKALNEWAVAVTEAVTVAMASVPVPPAVATLSVTINPENGAVNVAVVDRGRRVGAATGDRIIRNSPRAVEYRNLLAAGHTVAQVAEMFGIEESTVRDGAYGRPVRG